MLTQKWGVSREAKVIAERRAATVAQLQLPSALRLFTSLVKPFEH